MKPIDVYLIDAEMTESDLIPGRIYIRPDSTVFIALEDSEQIFSLPVTYVIQLVFEGQLPIWILEKMKNQAIENLNTLSQVVASPSMN